MPADSSPSYAFFDLDGTITRKDTMFAFIRFCYPGITYFSGLILISPVLILNRLGIIPSHRAKEILLSRFFKGFTEQKFEEKGKEFARKILPGLVREIAREELSRHQESGKKVVVVTASLSAWCNAWCKENGLELIATEYEVIDGRISGKIRGRNCKGEEKVRRIKEKYAVDAAGEIVAYGDSKGDREMLELADEKYYRWKRIN